MDIVRKEELKKARQQNNAELSEILHCNKRFILMQNKVTNKKQDLLEKLATALTIKTTFSKPRNFL